jgi:hypothetical protein
VAVDLGALLEYRSEHFIHDQLAIEGHDDVVNFASRVEISAAANWGASVDV